MKGNQKQLLKQTEKNTAKDEQVLIFILNKQKQVRIKARETVVYKNLSGIPEQWTSLSCTIHVERCVSYRKQQGYETACYYE